MNKDKIVSLAREYVENTKCSCDPSKVMSCWRCLFEHNLFIIEEGKQMINREVEHEQTNKCPAFIFCQKRVLNTQQCIVLDGGIEKWIKVKRACSLVELVTSQIGEI